jgi:hypothetical protein
MNNDCTPEPYPNYVPNNGGENVTILNTQPMTGFATTSGYIQFAPQPDPKVCPHCGRCPHCGQPSPSPYQSWPGYPNPYIGGPTCIGGVGTVAYTAVTTYNEAISK